MYSRWVGPIPLHKACRGFDSLHFELAATQWLAATYKREPDEYQVKSNKAIDTPRCSMQLRTLRQNTAI